MSRFAAAPNTHARNQSSTSRHSSNSSTSGGAKGTGRSRPADDWEEDAWGDQSDDENFKANASAGAGVGTGKASEAGVSTPGAGQNSSSAGGAGSGSAQAPPPATRKGSGYGQGLWELAFGGGASKKTPDSTGGGEGFRPAMGAGTASVSAVNLAAGMQKLGVTHQELAKAGQGPVLPEVDATTPIKGSAALLTPTIPNAPNESSSYVEVVPHSPVLSSSPTTTSSAIRDDADILVEDPANAIKSLQVDAEDGSTTPVAPVTASMASTSNSINSRAAAHDEADARRGKRKRDKIIKCLLADDVDITNLRKLSWAGIPGELRPVVWQLLLGYLPAPASRRAPTLARKRQEYADAVRLAFAKGSSGLDQAIWHQICIDVPRTNPGIRLWQYETTQRSLERILYVWAIRHPASGYVQGINDLVTPFFQVFLSSYISVDPETFDTSSLPKKVLDALEADAFWCLSKLLDGIQDNYIFAQPGIQRQVARMKELCGRVDAPLAAHLEEQNVEFIQFAFRWMNCLLMREMSVKNIIRLWDTYLAEGTDAFSEFHLYVCLAFLVKWSEKLRSMDFQGIIMFLQSLPTQQWTEQNTELLLSEGFMWKSLFHDSGHFSRK